MNITIFLALIPLIIKLVDFAEKYITSPKSGAAKKEFVVNAIKETFGGVREISTGGQKETLEAVAPVVDKMINLTAAVMFPSAEKQ